MSVSADSPIVPAGGASKPSAEFGRTAMAILVTMVVLIAALTGILVETTWGNPVGDAVAAPDPGSFARR